MKRIISLLIAVFLMLSLCACGSTESSKETQPELTPTEVNSKEPYPVHTSDLSQSEESWVPPGIITIFVPDISNSYADKCARILSKYAEKYIGQKIVVKNTESFDALSAKLEQSDTSGAYIAFADMSSCIDNAAIGGAVPELSCMKAICGNTSDAYAVVVRSNEDRFNSIDELCEYAWDSDEALIFATNGDRRAFHIGAKLFADAEDFSFSALPMADNLSAFEALLTGNADCCVLKLSTLGNYRSYVKVLGLLSSEHSEVKKYSNVPTLFELGCDDAVMPNPMQCVFISSDAPDEAVAFYEEAFRLTMMDPDFVTAMTKYNVVFSDAEETEELLKELIDFVNSAPFIFD